MPTDNYQNYIKHLESIAQIYEKAPKTNVGWIYEGTGVQINATTQDGTTKHKKAEQLNQELRKNGAYSLFDQKQITAWLDLRNNAAHGKYSAYDEHQVAKLIEWVADFISKNPA